MKDNLLLTVWQEDRTEVRLLKERIQNVCTSITLASFAITAFLISKENPFAGPTRSWLFLCADVFLMLLLWVLTIGMMRDLVEARKCVNLRERLICEQFKTGIPTSEPFQDAKNEPITIRERGLYMVATLASLLIGLKMVLLWILVRG